MKTERPTHLVTGPSDRFTLCGLRKSTGQALPYMLAKFVPLHRQNYELKLCERCEHEAKDE